LYSYLLKSLLPKKAGITGMYHHAWLVTGILMPMSVGREAVWEGRLKTSSSQQPQKNKMQFHEPPNKVVLLINLLKVVF
jgi:hypothetical protein